MTSAPTTGQYAASASSLISRMKQEGIDWVVTVPDFVQLALHTLIEKPGTGIRSTLAANENQAIEIAAGLHFGGRKVAVMLQNQGFYNCINAIRALGVDGKVPLFLMIGQFGREYANLGQRPDASARTIVNRLEPMLDLLGVPYWRIERTEDDVHLGPAYRASRERSGASALLIGHYVAWN